MDLAIIDATVAQPPPLSSPESFRYATPIANAPLIRHVFRELAASGISRVRIVVDPSISDSMHRLLGNGTTAGIDVSWTSSNGGASRDALLAELELALDAGPVLLHPGDSLFGDQIRSMEARFETGDVDSVLPGQATVAPAPTSGPVRVSNTAVILGPATRSVLEVLQTAAGQGLGLVDSLLHSDCRLAVCAVTPHWAYDDTTSALLAANRMLLDSLPSPRTTDGSEHESNEINGRVSIDPSASISGSIIYGPVAIDREAVIEDCFIGPYTAIGAGAVLRGVELDNSMVLAGAEVSHPGSRVEGSIIGERCRVTRSFELPRGLHLHLANGSSVKIS
jgi:glucose-1-phosphate thymidylyltransferase